MPNVPDSVHTGDYVEFSGRDVRLPDAHQVLFDLNGGRPITGTVIQCSIGGEAGTTFAAIQVERLPYYCVVATADLRVVAKTNGRDASNE